MQQANYDHTSFQNERQAELDKKLLVRFFMKNRKDEAASKKEGRPIFREVEYVDIKVPGKRTSGACRPATFQDKQRFSDHYDAFKKRIEAPSEGTPLMEWPLITRSQAEELAFYNVKTVEQLAGMTDGNAQNFMGIHALKRKAEAYIKESNETAKIEEMDGLKNDNKTLKEQLEQMKNQMNQMAEKLNSQPEAEAPKRKRGRPKKVK